MVSKVCLRVIVAYRITLAVGQEVHGVAINLRYLCQDAVPYIPLCNLVVEIKPARCGHTRSDVCTEDVRINWEHPSPLLIAGAII
jgi:hypothetical protein